jgi:hypothetical protein
MKPDARLEERLRALAARERKRNDPGDLFFAALPDRLWDAVQSERTRRDHRRRLLARVLAPTFAVCVGAAAVLLLLSGHHVAPTARGSASAPAVASPIDPPEPASVDEAAFVLDPPALEKLADELGTSDAEYEDLPVDALLDRMSDSELRALAADLPKG